MKGYELEVRVNIEERYNAGDGHRGQLTEMIDGAERDVHLNGTFRELIGYVLKRSKNINDEQKDVHRAISEKIANESAHNKIVIEFYNEHDERLDQQLAPGDTYLDDIVKDRTGTSVELVNLGVASRPSVG